MKDQFSKFDDWWTFDGHNLIVDATKNFMHILRTLGQPHMGEKKLYQKERYKQMVSCLNFPLVDCPCHVWHYSYVISTTQLFQFVVINNAFVLWSRPTGFDQRVTILYIHSLYKCSAACTPILASALPTHNNFEH